MKIAVASGKGGTGKTTIALALSGVGGTNTWLMDCDVEEPNCHLFVKAGGQREAVGIPMPVINEKLCNGCGECGKFCQYNAIAVLDKRVLLFPELCHGCDGCVKICPTGALTEKFRTIGDVGISRCDGFLLVDGRLSIGQAMSPPLIRAVKKHRRAYGVTIIDCPPGTSCPMVAAVRDSDFVLLVTEPTPFGLHDLTLAVETLRQLELPFGVIINRADSGDDKVKSYCGKENIPVMLEIPNSRKIAEAYSRGETMLQAAPELRPMFEQLLQDIARMTGQEVEK